MPQDSPSFYAIVPAHVRYCKELEPSAKLLYGEITALCSHKGYCWAGNQYFADLYQVDIRTIKRWIFSLKKLKFIVIDHEREGFLSNRRLWVSEEIKKMFTKGQKCHSGRDKNVPHINTGINTPKEKKEESLISFGEFVKLTQSQYDHFVSQENKSFIDDVIDDINNYCESSGKKYKSFKGAVSTFIKKKKLWETQNNKNKKSGVSKNEFDRRWHKAKEAIRELEKKGMTATELGIKDIKSGIVVAYDHINYSKFLQKIGFYYILN